MYGNKIRHGGSKILRQRAVLFLVPDSGGSPSEGHLGKSKRGLTNGGLSPKFSEKIGQNSFRENRAFSGPIGAFSGSVGAFWGLIGNWCLLG